MKNITYLEFLVGLNVPELITGLPLGVEDGSLEQSHPLVHLQTQVKVTGNAWLYTMAKFRNWALLFSSIFSNVSKFSPYALSHSSSLIPLSTYKQVKVIYYRLNLIETKNGN